jgi:hypothetical protein
VESVRESSSFVLYSSEEGVQSSVWKSLAWAVKRLRKEEAVTGA